MPWPFVNKCCWRKWDFVSLGPVELRDEKRDFSKFIATVGGTTFGVGPRLDSRPNELLVPGRPWFVSTANRARLNQARVIRLLGTYVTVQY